MQRFEYSYIISIFSHISGKCQSCRSWTDNSYFEAVFLCNDRYGDLSAFTFVISGKTFQITDGNRLFIHLQVDAFWFALFFLRAYTTANGRQCAGLFQCFRCFKEFTTFDVLDKAGNIDAYRATFHASRIRTVQTTLGFRQCLFFSQALIDLFFTAVRTVLGIQFVHLDTWDGGTFFGFHRFT